MSSAEFAQRVVKVNTTNAMKDQINRNSHAVLSGLFVTLRGNNTLSTDATRQKCFVSSEKGSSLKGNNLLTKLFPFRVDPFPEEIHQLE